MEIRRLDPVKDADLYRQAYRWTLEAPRWLRDCAKVFEAPDEDSYIAEAATPGRVDIGIFVPEFTGMISLVIRGVDVYEAYIAAKRHSPLELLSHAVLDIYNTMVGYGMQQTFVWIAARNRAILQLCEGVGFEQTGLEMWKGSSHGRPIHWRQLAIYGITH